jgi:ABC-2 type transport system permease protein
MFVVILRVIVWGILGFVLIGSAVLCGYLAWKAVAAESSLGLTSLLAGIALFWQFFSINGLSIAATLPTFDPSSLLRFPLRFGRYLVVRTLLGLLSPVTIAGCLTLLATAIGIGIANHALLLPALIVLAVYALMNVFLTRMIEAWFERWLAVRRFREIFSAAMALFFVGIQFLNFGSASSSPQRAVGLLTLLRGSIPLLHWLPPAFAANSILLAAGNPLTALLQFSALLFSTALFLYVFAIRIHKQFLGEYLSEGAARRISSSSLDRMKLADHSVAVASQAASESVHSLFSPVITACLRKEWASFRGNTAQLTAMIVPLLFVFVFSRRFAQYPAFFLPGATAYVLFAQLAALYNIFGADGPGVQLYLLAPVRLRDVVIAKNIVSLTLLLAEVLLAWGVVAVLSSTVIPLPALLSAALWTVFVIAVNLTLGTMRSIQAPRRFIPGQIRQTRSTPVNRSSGLLVLAVLFGSIFLQFPVNILCSYFQQPWLAAMIFAPLAAGAIAAYAFLLHNADRLILSHRDLFAEELCKA